MDEIKKETAVRGIPEPALRRLPVYLQYLKKALENKTAGISCTTIARDMRLGAVQVRKDIELTGAVGRPKTGYDTAALIDVIEEFLGLKNNTDVFLAGVGSLGAAILGYQGFREYRLNIVAAFDTDPAKAGGTVHGKKIYRASKMAELIKRMKVRMGIITVPAKHAQETADIMISSGITGIWNFAPVKISAPPGVIVHNENLAASLAVLSKKINVQKENEV